MLPFTREEFFGVFAAHNDATWPAAIIAYPLALTAVLFAWRGSPQAGRASAAVLALMWVWVGFVYQGLYFTAINPIASAFAIAFILQAGLFAYHAWTRLGLEYGPRSRLRTVAGGAMIVYALLLYPMIGLVTGERYPAMRRCSLSLADLHLWTNVVGCLRTMVALDHPTVVGCDWRKRRAAPVGATGLGATCVRPAGAADHLARPTTPR